MKSPEHVAMRKVLATFLANKGAPTKETRLLTGKAKKKKPKPIPGEFVTPFGMYMMAQCYRANADALEAAAVYVLTHFSDYPRRLLYYQALEHFLRSFLRLNSLDPGQIRAHQHDFAAMLDCGKGYGLRISEEAEAFIRSSTLRNDYVRIRYELHLEEDLGLDDVHWEDDPEDLERASMLSLKQVVFELEMAAGLALQAAGREVMLPKTSPANG
jgi:hypothetical protein